MAVFIATGGTLILTVTLNILLALGMATVNKEYRGKVFPLSRILGSVVNVVWQGNIVFLTILLLSTLPIDDKRMDALRTQVPESKMMNFYKETIINRDVRFQAVVKSLGTLRDPDEVAQIAHTPEFEAFRKQPKLQKFINDPDVIQAMESKNGLKLIGNPSLRELLTDDSAMMSFTSLAQMVYQKNFKDLAETSEKKPAS